MTQYEILKFLGSLFSDVTGNLVILQQQNSPKPPKPYLAIRSFAIRRLGQDEILPGLEVTDVIVSGPRQFTLEVQWIGENGEDGLSNLEQHMNAPTIIDRCFSFGVAIDSSENIQNISGLLDDADWEKRYSLDFTVRTTKQIVDSPGVIQEVNIDASGLGNDININIDTKD